MSGLRIGLTGHRGFIGQHLVSVLRSLGAQVWLPEGDVRAAGTWTGDFDLLYHLVAALPDRFAEEPCSGFSVNLDGTLKALEACRVREARLVFASTCGVYSPAESGAIAESCTVDPQAPYAQSKLMAEMLCSSYANHFGVPSTVLRLFNVYGPGQKLDFLIPYLVECALENCEAIVHNPTNSCDFVHVSDVVEALVCSASQKGPFEVLNIGRGRAHTVREVITTIGDILGCALLWKQGDGRPDSQPAGYADIGRAAAVLKWRPTKDLDWGLRNLIREMNPNCDVR